MRARASNGTPVDAPMTTTSNKCLKDTTKGDMIKMSIDGIALSKKLVSLATADCTPGAKRRLGTPSACTILANSVQTRLSLLGYGPEHTEKAMVMSMPLLCKDWTALNTLASQIVSTYVASVTPGESTPGDDIPDAEQSDSEGEGEDQEDQGEGEDQGEDQSEGEGEDQGEEQGEEQEGQGEGEGQEQQRAQGEKQEAQGEEQEPQEAQGEGEDQGEGEGEGQAQDQPEALPDGYIKPSNYNLAKKCLEMGFNVLFVGPRGTGKTEMAIKLAEEMERRLYMVTSPQTRYEVTGYADANGREVTTQVTEAITDSEGFLLIEEMDRSAPEALIPMNAMLANGLMDTPVRGVIEVSPDLRIIATANTCGHGRTEEYVTANRLDASTLDRFVVIHVDYEPYIDKACATGPDGSIDNKLVEFVQSYRQACKDNYLESYTISYRGVRNIKRLSDAVGIRTALEISLVKDAICKADLATICGSMKCRNAYANELKNIMESMRDE